MSGCAFACAANSGGGGYRRSSASRVSIVVGRSRSQVVGVVGEVLDAVLGDEDEILEPDAAVAVPVEPGLDRDDVAGDHRPGARPSHGDSCTSSPTPWPSPW